MTVWHWRGGVLGCNGAWFSTSFVSLFHGCHKEAGLLLGSRNRCLPAGPNYHLLSLLLWSVDPECCRERQAVRSVYIL